MTRFLLVLLAATTLSAQNLKFEITAPAEIQAGQPATWHVVIRNVSGRDLPAAPMSMQFQPGTVQSLPAELACRQETSSFRCTMPALQRDAQLAFDVVAVHPFRYGDVIGSVSVSYTPGFPDSGGTVQTYWREFAVTNTRDAGPGSLRQTILDVNTFRDCQHNVGEWPVPCKVAFRITEPVPAEGWYTIRPSAPLPPMTANEMSIDGTTQTASNPLGPAVALDGSALAFGNGIVCDTRCSVRGLAIGGFPWNGVYATRRAYLNVGDSFIGVDPTGQQPRPNGSRGIAVDSAQGGLVRNVISGNGRSGIFFAGAAGTGPHIRDNRIGVAAHDDTPIGNGASGIFIGDFPGYYADPTIEGNVIANNAHFGIALGRNAPMIILGNTIRDNGGGGIDIGLDGPTDLVPGVPGVQGGVIAPPVILSATYSDGVTTIKGFVKRSGTSDRRQVVLYANSTIDSDGFAEGEQFLGITPTTFRDDTSFTFVHPGDLRGKYVNGTVTAVTFWGFDDYSYTSSEFGRAVPVQ